MIENLHGRNYELAKAEADKVDEQIIEVLQAGHSFRVEAGAGSGKTYSLNKVIESAVTLPCLPVSFQHITCAQVGNKYELTSALIGQKSDLKLPPNSGEDVSVFYFQLGNNFARIL